MKTIHYQTTDGVGVLTLSRPERKNAIDMVLRQELLAVLREARADKDLRVLVLTGAGGNFCSGGDIRSMRDSAAAGENTAVARRQRVMDVHELVTELIQFDRPVIAAVEGVAYGAGFSIALAADLTIAAESARLCFSFARIGLVPDFGAFYTLPRLVGLQQAKALVFSGREIRAREAQTMGLVLESVPDGQAFARAIDIARSLSQASPHALSLAKRALDVSPGSDLRTMLMVEADAQGIAMTTEYHAEAIRRFLAKETGPSLWPAG